MFESIITSDTGRCIICGCPLPQEHHALSGTANRKLSDEDKLTVPLCAKHHNMDSRESVHLNPIIGKWCKIVGQLAYEKKMVAEGHTEDEARQMFLRRYGKSFL